MSDQLRQRAAWVSHLHACEPCGTPGSDVCPEGAELAAAVLDGMLPDESLMTLIPQKAGIS